MTNDEVMLASRSWCMYSEEVRLELLRRCRALEADVYALRARGWDCTREEARQRMLVEGYGCG